MQANAMREFELLGPNEDKPNPLLLERLRACCQVINALGYKVTYGSGPTSVFSLVQAVHWES
jgi:hypothetical protein